MIRIGILSDTHLSSPDDRFRLALERAFPDVTLILHAGDLTDITILDDFAGKEIIAVHGNMCMTGTRTRLPAQRTVHIAGWTIGLTHGNGPGINIEERVMDLFPQADCIVFGHTHRPLCRRYGATLLVNPGSFGAGNTFSATCAIMELDSTAIRTEIRNAADAPDAPPLASCRLTRQTTGVR